MGARRRCGAPWTEAMQRRSLMALQQRELRRRPRWWMALVGLALLAGCGGKDAVLPPSGDTMLEIYQRHAGRQGASTLLEQRSRLRRPLTDAESMVDPCLRDNLAEITGQFRRL